jgi:antitoxin HigA-1
MATNRMRPIHPGEVLREEFLAPLGMTANALAMALHVPAPRINEVVRERRAITTPTRRCGSRVTSAPQRSFG